MVRMPRTVMYLSATPMRERLLGCPGVKYKMKLRDTNSFLLLTESLPKLKLRTEVGSDKMWS